MLTLQALSFEDLSVGMTERLAKTVASSDVVGFAEVTGDRNPIHLSEHFAAKTPFGTRIAHGLYTASLISAVLGTRLPGPGAIYISQTLNFRAPVKIGDTVEVNVTVAELMPEKIPRAADLHLFGGWRDRARRRGLGEGAVKGSRRPAAAARLALATCGGAKPASDQLPGFSFQVWARKSSAANRPAACSANRRRRARAATGCRAPSR